MPRKDNINKNYHSNNPRSRGMSNAGGSVHDYFSQIPLSPSWAQENGKSLYNILTTGKIQNERDYWIYSVANAIPGLSGYLQGIGQYEDLKSYMEKYNLSWNDVKPWRIANTGAQAFYRQTTNFIGDMVKELYS